MKFRSCLLVATVVLTGSCDSPSGPGGGGVATLQVGPDPATVVVDGSVQMEVTALDGSEAPVTDAPLFWSSEDSLIARVSPAGLVTGRTPGSVRVAVSSGGVSALATVIVQPKPVATVTISPADTTIIVDGEVTLTASARDADGGTLTGRPVSWASSAPDVAMVEENGRVVGVSAGSAEISATIEGKVGVATVQVGSKPVARVEVDPAAVALLLGQAMRLSATAFAADGSELTGRRTSWSSSNPQIASVSSSGLVTARGLGATSVTATIEGKRASVGVAVGLHPVATITVSPSAVELPVGGERELVAILRAADGAVLTGRPISWSSSSNAVARISSSGRLTAVAPGMATITARSEGRSATASVRVVRRGVGSVEISPRTVSLTPGGTEDLSVVVRADDGTVLTGRTVTWRSSAEGVARVTSNGRVTAIAPGSATITATSEGVSGTATVTVSARPVATVEVSPSSLTLGVGEAEALQVTLEAADGSALTGRAVEWRSNAAGVATVDATGRVTAVGPGEAIITATSEGVSGSATVTVQAQPVATVAIIPSAVALVAGERTTLQAETRGADGAVLTDRDVTWESSTPEVASVDGNGEVTAIAPGLATITASSEGVSGTASVTVSPATVASVEVNPSSLLLSVNEVGTLQAIVRSGSGEVLEGREIVWSSDTEGVASVAADGTVTALGAGTATITATSEGVSGHASVTVQGVPARLTIVSGDDQWGGNNVPLRDSLVVAVYDADGQPMEGVRVVWNTDNGRLAPTESVTDADGRASSSWSPVGGGFLFPRYAYARVEGLPAVRFSSRRL